MRAIALDGFEATTIEEVHLLQLIKTHNIDVEAEVFGFEGASTNEFVDHCRAQQGGCECTEIELTCG